MSISSRLAGALLLTTALCTPTLAHAQNEATAPAETPPSVKPAGPVEPRTEDVEISVPGGDIVVTGRRDRNIAKSSDQVVSVLSTAEIARTGDGNIAGALGRVTGLSVVGNGFEQAHHRRRGSLVDLKPLFCLDVGQSPLRTVAT